MISTFFSFSYLHVTMLLFIKYSKYLLPKKMCSCTTISLFLFRREGFLPFISNLVTPPNFLHRFCLLRCISRMYYCNLSIISNCSIIDDTTFFKRTDRESVIQMNFIRVCALSSYLFSYQLQKIQLSPLATQGLKH